MSDLPDGVYELVDDRFVPAPVARGPWSPMAQHGGPPAGLLARTVERTPSTNPMQLARLTVELLRPVPLEPLEVRSRVVRDGRKIQIVEASILAGDVEVSRAVGLRIRTGSVELPPGGPPAPEPLPAPAGALDVVLPEVGFWQAVEFHHLPGRRSVVGQGQGWIGLRIPLVAGEPNSPLVELATLADFIGGISGWLPYETFTYINPDATIYLDRPPVGGLLGIRAASRAGRTGMGVVDAELFDAAGYVGQALQSQVIEHR